MKGHLREGKKSESAQLWASIRPVQEPIAWMLIAVVAGELLVSAWQLFGLPHADVHGPATPVTTVAGAAARTGLASVATFTVRAAVVAPDFVAGGLFLLPILSLLLVAFAGGPTPHARPVAQAAVVVQTVALGLGVVSWAAAFGAHLRTGVWFVMDGVDLVAMAAALLFGVTVLRSVQTRLGRGATAGH